MKKNTTLIIVAVVALAVGYLLGANVGSGDSSQTKGDINAVNTYKQLLTAPEYMAFNKSMADNQDAVNHTVSTLQIVERRIADFVTIAGMMNSITVADPEISPSVAEFQKAEEEGKRAMAQAEAALQAALQLKAGQKVDMKKALKNAEAAMAYLDTQLAMGKQFVEASDAFLKDKDIKEHIMTATIRDLVVSHCAVNAALIQKDSDIDYWSNVNGIVKSEDMAFTLK